MPIYHYKAKKGPTEIFEGEINAENEDAALGKISAQGLIPLKLELASAVKDSSGRKKEDKSASASQVPEKISLTQAETLKLQIQRRDFDIFTRQFAILLKANVPLLRIFNVLQTQTKNPKFKWLLTDIQDRLRSGSSLSDALRHYPRVFSPLYINMVESGEISGMLDVVLMRLAQFSEKEAEIRARIQSAMIYPFFLLAVGILTIFVLLTFILPRLMVVFEDLGTKLPPMTQVIIDISHVCQQYWIVMILVAGGMVVLFKTPKVIEACKKMMDPWIINLPVFGELIKKTETTKFLRSLELLYDNGIPLFKAVEVSARTVENKMIQESLAKIPHILQGGATLTQSLEQIPFMSSFVTNMVSVGEESGKLSEAIKETASFYEQETAQTMKVATALVEPFMILFIGGMIGFIVIAMLLPVFEISAIAQ